MKKILLLTVLLLSAFTISAQNLTMQNGSFTRCSGNFFDSGGNAGDYGANELFTITICPTTPGDAVQLDFNQWDVEATWDDLTIYNGDSTADPVIGTFSATSPGTISAATGGDCTGCITLVWDSDGTGQQGGWRAAMSCVTQTSCVTPCTAGPGTGTTTLGCPAVIAGGLGLGDVDPPAIDCSSGTNCERTVVFTYTVPLLR